MQNVPLEPTDVGLTRSNPNTHIVYQGMSDNVSKSGESITSHVK